MTKKKMPKKKKQDLRPGVRADDREFEFDESAENMFSDGENEDETDDDDEEEPRPELPHTLVLEYPYTVANTEVVEVVFQNPLTVGMIVHFPVGETDKMKLGHFLPVVVGMVGLPTEVVKKMAPSDFNKCIEVVTRFF